MDLGGVFIDLNQPQAALDHFLQAEKTFRDTQEQFRLAHIYNNIGHAYLALDQPEDAVTALENSVRLWDQIGGYDYWRLNALTCLGVAHLRGGFPKTAVDVLSYAQHLLPTIEHEPKHHNLSQEIAEELQRAREGLVGKENG
jgi:tetratricopeptide (TPR) repeat protein